ncbi:hypothetical protein SAMN04490243_2038 [Robiginitalea myxolifaciens]|uniref:Tetratricopeptide repeat-containing protein n=1 Tax=Robiginitalea myxolifaciens TaxID=400055 RepID=A0A1I6H139_9FLAO|nr:DUF6340 family protein [Robiginitalea myxolifaciens]SFR48165.1 hypothetical protein SAMN04490243_2038 [Robiginitalea myxolifaciens]
MRSLVYLGFLSLLLFSCSATHRLSMTVTEPAVVSLPKNVQRVGIINRSIPSEGKGTLAKIDAILSAEGMQLDRDGSQAALQGLADRLRTSNRFEAVVILDSLPQLAKGTLAMPAALSREQLRELCATYGLDAVFSLAYYDTATQVRAEIGMREVTGTLGIPVKVPMHRLDLTTALRSGWRIYLPQVPLPVDQWEYTDYLRVSGQGINPVEALESIRNRKERVLDISRQTGFVHGSRLEPSRIRVGRDYFVRGNDSFERGKRLAQTGAWNEAAQLWEAETAHPKDKIAGRAHYNMAIINEINGDLEAAHSWAKDAYAIYGNREALRYIRILERRLAAQAELEMQLSGLTPE